MRRAKDFLEVLFFLALVLLVLRFLGPLLPREDVSLPAGAAGGRVDSGISGEG